MSQTSRTVLETLTKDYIWMRNLKQLPESHWMEQLQAVHKKFQTAASAPAASASSMGTATTGSRSGFSRAMIEASSAVPASVVAGSNEGTSAPMVSQRCAEWNKAVKGLTDVATERLAETTLQNTKQNIFS
jgi:hypothetical protein